MERKEPRQHISGEAKLIFGTASEISCTICNISRGGAMLLVPYMAWLPLKFELQDSTGVRRQVTLAWQGSEHIGVRYTDRAPRRRAPAFGRRVSNGSQ